MLVMKDGKAGPGYLKVSSSPSYTLKEIEALAREWIEIPNGPVDYSPALTLSTFIAWLAKREREGLG